MLSSEKKRIIFVALSILVGAAAVICYAAITGNTNQVFTDVVNEFTAINGSNKSAEKNMFYIFAFVGMVLYGVVYLFRFNDTQDEIICDDRKWRYIIDALSIFVVTEIILYKSVNKILLVGLMLAVIAMMISKKLVVSITAFFFISIYAVIGLYRIFAYAGGTRNISLLIVLAIAFVLGIIFVISRNEKVVTRGILLIQTFIPFTFLIFIQNKYSTVDTKEYIINVPLKVQLFIWTLVAGFVVESIYRLKKFWNSDLALSNVISYGTCSSIMAFNQYMGQGSIINLDLHHQFEDIIGYSQIFELGQKPYTQYVPVSGMYSVFQGFLWAKLGRGNVSFYNLTLNLYSLFIILLIVFLLKKQIKAEWVLFISLVFYLGDYNRFIWMTPFYLLLSLPSLIERKNLWLKVWMLTSLFHGLYYPVYGAAICLGFLPLGIWQIYTYAKCGSFKKDAISARFWLLWLICFVPVIISFNLLLGTARHMLAMASQTIYADGIARFAQVFPDDFLAYVPSVGIRLVLYYLVSCFLIICIVWISTALFFVNGNIRINNKAIRIYRPVEAFISIALGIVVLVSISFTVVRMDVGWTYARSEGFIRLAFVVLTLLVAKYMYSRNKNAIWGFSFACFIIAAVSGEGINNIDADAKLEAYYKVPEDYVYADGSGVPRLGECFIPNDKYDAVIDSYTRSQLLDKSKSYLGIAGYFGEYYLDEIKGDSVLELYLTIKGYDATKETVDLIRKNNTIVGYSLDPVNNYYMYHYLGTSGEYVYEPENRWFVPNNSTMTREEILDFNKTYLPALEDCNLGKTAGSWGSSMGSLEYIFTDVDTECSIITDDGAAKIQFGKNIQGDEADFVYIEFDDMDKDYDYVLFNYEQEIVQEMAEKSWARFMMNKRYNPDTYIVVVWNDDAGQEHSMKCRMDEGKLLIPLGGGKGWLFDLHSDIRVSVTNEDGTEQEMPDIANIRMLKLRELK